MGMQVPTGYFLDDHLIWGDPGAGAIMSRTYAADFPDLSASDDSAFDLLESNCRLMLVSLRPGERLQLYHYTSNDLNRPLDRYAAQTAKSKIEICSKVRGDIEARFRKLMNTERLIQANVRISLCLQSCRLLSKMAGAKCALSRTFSRSLLAHSSNASSISN